MKEIDHSVLNKQNFQLSFLSVNALDAFKSETPSNARGLANLQVNFALILDAEFSDSLALAETLASRQRPDLLAFRVEPRLQTLNLLLDLLDGGCGIHLLVRCASQQHSDQLGTRDDFPKAWEHNVRHSHWPSIKPINQDESTTFYKDIKGILGSVTIKVATVELPVELTTITCK